MRAPLKATISDVIVDLGGPKHNPVTIPNYTGRPFFLRAASDGTTLKIDISNVPNANPAGPPTMKAQVADVTITYVHPPSPTVTQHFTVNPISFNPPKPLELKMRVSSNLQDAELIVGTERPQDPSDVDLTFVLIEDGNSAAEPRLRLEWIDPAISVEKADTRTTASLVPRDPADGGALGPMGMATP